MTSVTGLNLSNVTKLGLVEVLVCLPLLESYSVGVIGSFEKHLDFNKMMYFYISVDNDSNIKKLITCQLR